MFKKFIKNLKFIFKTANLEHSANLIYVENRQIKFNEKARFEITHIKELMERLTVENHIYDDLPYKRLYVEYKEHQQVYDANPILLYCNIPIILSADYEGLRCDFKEIISEHILDVATVDPICDLPRDFLGLIIKMYQKTSGYFDRSNEFLTESEFVRLSKFNFYKDWNYFYTPFSEDNLIEYRRRLRIYLNSVLDILIDFGGVNNHVTIANIIKRILSASNYTEQKQ